MAESLFYLGTDEKFSLCVFLVEEFSLLLFFCFLSQLCESTMTGFLDFIFIFFQMI